nr:MAG: matrix protein [Rhabdoviridae sp.]
MRRFIDRVLRSGVDEARGRRSARQDQSPLDRWGGSLAAVEAPAPPRPQLQLVSYDVTGELKVISPVFVDRQAFFGRMSVNFPHFYQGDALMKPYHTTVFALLVAGLRTGIQTDRGWIYRSTVAECVTIRGLAMEIPHQESRIFRDSFTWKYRGDSYVWSVTISWTRSYMVGVPLDRFIPVEHRTLLSALGVKTIWNREGNYLSLRSEF